MSEESYAQWRATIPFTNAQFVAQLRRDADDTASSRIARKYEWWAEYLERTGRLSGYVLRHCLPALITVCALCGKKALYRQGTEGRCSAHRMILTTYVAARRARQEAAGVHYETAQATQDRRDKSSSRRAGGGGRGLTVVERPHTTRGAR